MIRRVRLLYLLARPAVLVLLALFAATGLAQAAHGQGAPALGTSALGTSALGTSALGTSAPEMWAPEMWALARVLVVVAAFLLFSVACNDLADEAIDRVNLPGDGRRPLVAGTANRHEMVVLACGSAVVALGASCTLRWPGIVVTVAGLACSAAYSLRPVRLADRGAVASVALPACYVAVPYLLGILAVRPSVRPADLALLAGLYVGFIGRILLKDFRDVRGDTLFGKRTFLVRHGRRWTCRFSAACWTVGAVLLVVAVPHPGAALIGGSAAYLVMSLGLLRALASARSHRREEALIAALAITGRGLIVSVLAYLSMTGAGWSPVAVAAGLAALLGLTAGQAALMARRGPATRLTVAAMPAAPTAASTAASTSASTAESRFPAGPAADTPPSLHRAPLA